MQESALGRGDGRAHARDVLCMRAKVFFFFRRGPGFGKRDRGSGRFARRALADSRFQG